MSRLQERSEQLKWREEDERRWVRYNAAKVERDRLAVELSETYPAIERQLVDLLTHLDANDRKIEHINEHKLPNSTDRLLVAELVARGLKGFVQGPAGALTNIPRLTQSLRLPAFEYNAQAPLAWPRRM